MFAYLSSKLFKIKLVALLVLFTLCAKAETFSVENAQISLNEGVYYLDSSLSLPISEVALTAIKNSVPLYIGLEISIKKTNNWWLDSNLATIEQVFKIEYFELAKLYQLTNVNTEKQHNYLFLGEALLSIGTIKKLPLIDKILLADNEQYYIEIDIDLLISKLPTPLIPAALVSAQWEHESLTHQVSLEQ